MLRLFFLIFFSIISASFSQSEVSADWDISIDGNNVTLSIVQFNNFTVGLDGHWHYILDQDEYVAIHDINDVVLENLSNGDHTLNVWLVDHMHNSLDPPVEEIFYFNINTGLSTNTIEILDMMIYPNPVDGDYVTIISPVEGSKEIQVYTVTGRKVMDTVINGNTLDVSSFNTGFYMMKVTINGQTKVSKLVVR